MAPCFSSQLRKPISPFCIQQAIELLKFLERQASNGLKAVLYLLLQLVLN